MAKLTFKAGTTSKDVNILIQDSSVSTGAGKTGIAYNTSGLTAYYHRQGSNAATAITLATKTLGTWATGGFVEVSSANMPGLYEFGIPDAALASGATWVVIMLFGVTNMAPVTLEIELTSVDNQDAVRMGLSALPNASAGANGGLPTVDSNNAVKVQSGTGANQISLSGGLVTLAGVTHTGATIPTVTTTGTATNVTTVNGLASGAITAASIAADAITAAKIADGAIDAATFAAGAINAAAIAADAITDAKVASDVTIASVTGAVGSVTGNVGGNVVGSVGSVTTVSDKTGYSLSTAGIQAIWDRAVSNLTTASSIGKLIVDNLNATISGVMSRLGTPANADLATDIAAIQSDTNDIQTRLPSGLNSGNILAHVVSVANNAITAAAIAAGAIDADALASDAVTEIGSGISVSAPTVDQIDTKLTAMHGSGAWGTATGFATPTNVSDGTATVVASIGAQNNLSAAQVWSYGSGRTLTRGAAPSVSDIWNATTRTLTSPTPGSTTPPAVSGTQLSIKKATSFDVTVTGMTIPSNWSKVYWTVKSSTGDADSAAILQLVKTSGGAAGDGMIRLNGAANTGHESEGALTVDQAAGSVTIAITDDYTALINASNAYTSDFKVITSASKSTQLAICPVSVDSAVTLAVS